MRRVLCFLVFTLDVSAQRPRLSRKPPAAEDFDKKSVTVTGTVIEADAKAVRIDASDHRILTFQLDKSTKLPPAALEPGDHVRVQGKQDDEAFLTAEEISLEKVMSTPVSATAVPAAGAVPLRDAAPPTVLAKAPVVYKPAKPDPEDEGPPRLRHGQANPPPARPLPTEVPIASKLPVTASVTPAAPNSAPESSAPDSLPAGSGNGAPAADPKVALVERAREWALSFTDSLPNYVCQQFTTRYVKPPGQRDWQAKDVVSANVVYENGKEDYRNIAINGKAQSKKMEELPGSWSTGEFGTTLRSLFHPRRQAAFRYVKQTQITGLTASVYNYSVKRENSDWRVQLGGQAIIPAYSGRVWIDQNSGRVIRIEMQAEEIPTDFPLDKVEASNDYGLIRLATADQFMLPLHAETLSCERGTPYCSRNAIEFRNYHKYSGETNITFDK